MDDDEQEDRDEERRASIGVIGHASHNARVVQIKRFVLTPPRGAVFLRLAVREDASVLCSHSKDECIKDRGLSIPDGISLALEEHARTTEREVKAILGWCRADGSTIVTKDLKARPPRAAVAPLPGMTLEETALLVGDGDGRAFVQSVIRSNEIYLRSNIQGHHATLSIQRDLAETANDQAKTAMEMSMQMMQEHMKLVHAHSALLAENALLRAELEARNKVIADLTDDEPTVGPETDSARAELIKQVTQGVTRAAPEAWSMFKLYMVQQARAQQQAPNGHANGHANGGA